MDQMPWYSSSRWTALYLFFCGICMGAADLIPGISGGTVAFIMGFYDQLLDSIKTVNFINLKLLLTLRWRLFFQAINWKFLFPLLSGVIMAFALLTHFFHFILEHPIYRVYFYSTFLGLILASFWFCIRQVKNWNGAYIVGLLLGIILAYLLTGSETSKEQGSYAIAINLDHQVDLKNYDSQRQLLTHLTESTLGAMLAKKVIGPNTEVYYLDGTVAGIASELVVPYHPYWIDPWLVLCGAIAICALLLPGISGSYLLTLLGVYPIVMAALVDFFNGIGHFSFDYEAFSILFSLSLGIFVGIALFARVVSWLMKHYPNLSIAVLSGFMIGALRGVWPFWSYTYTMLPLKLEKGPQLALIAPLWPVWQSSLFWIAIAFASLGFAFVFLIESLANLKLVSVKPAQSG